jgi:UDP-glucose 4-epimerase
VKLSTLAVLKKPQSKIQFIPYDQLRSGFEDIARRVPDTSKLQSLTGWKATKNLDAIIDDTIAELKSHQP